MHTDLVRFLSDVYPLSNVQVTGSLVTKGQRKALRLQSDQGQFVVKIADPGRPEEVVQSDTGILTYLAQYGFPAPRLLLTCEGQPYLLYKGYFLHIYTYLVGVHPRPGAEFMHQAGQVLAHLHNLPYQAYGKPSTYHPAAILAEVRGYLTQALATDQTALAGELLEIVEAFPNMAGLPAGLIHTDPYLVNWIQDDSGKLFLIDWDDAGVGIPIIDAAYGAGHLCTYPRHEAERWGVPVGGPITWREDWSQIFLTGYQSVRRLTPVERELFSAALDLNFLAYVWDWDSRRLIPENVLRMKMLRELRLTS